MLQLFDGQLDKIRLQKLLFLFAKKQSKPEYDFIPYKFGCYSYSANADMTAMVKRGFLAEDSKSFAKKDLTDYLTQLRPADLQLLQEVKATYGKMSSSVLMKLTYVNFPFYAIKSEVAEHILSAEEFKKVTYAKPQGNKTVLFTIGYEGISLEEYLIRLLKNDVKVLVDVRHNPLSMKFGFSKNKLKKYCASVGIEYEHFPEVGIHSTQRQELNNQYDYDQLFTVYREINLTETKAYQNEILKLLKLKKRIALTCFEANVCQCHRKHLAEAIESRPDFNYTVKHI